MDKPPYRDRRIHVRARLSADEALFVIRDEGRGFDHSAHAPAKRTGTVGECDRGLTLMHAFMDSVTFSDSGNEVTMIKKAACSRSASVAMSGPATNLRSGIRQNSGGSRGG